MGRNVSTRSLVALGLVAAAVAICFFFFIQFSPARAQARPVVHVRWLISHQPTEVFRNATRVFADELAKETDGAMVLDIVTPQAIGVEKGDVPNSKVFQLLDSGDVQLATAYTVALGYVDKDVWSFNLPFAFDGYGQIAPVLDGPAGSRLLSGLASSTSARGLAFTMSGGFRIIISKDKVIHAPQDLKGLRIATSGGPVAEATLKALGAIPVPLDLESGSAAIDSKRIDGIETTYSRLSEVVGSNSVYTKQINETNHSMFLTAILASNSFYNSLSSRDQAALMNAAHAAAIVERQDSITLGDATRAQLGKEGSTITTVSSAERDAFKKAVQPVYTEFHSLVPLLGEIAR